MKEKSYLKKIMLLVMTVLTCNSLIAQSLAFPEAEGFGRFAQGGRGGDVYHVTNLDDSGLGSLRYGVEQMTGPRTIVFDIAGTIQLNDKLNLSKPNLTIAGQTAPGDGITLAGGCLYIKNNDIIVRYIRCRLGDQSGGDDDAISITKGSNIILDHVTASWSVDETLSCQSDEVDLLTVQWCLVSESLRYSHHEKGAHGYGGILGSLRQSFHHNLYAHHSSRSPKVTWRQHSEVDFRNNVIYNWGYNNCYDGTSSYMNWANNYYKAGPATDSDVQGQIFELSDENVGDYQNYETSLYTEGNYVKCFPDVTDDNWNGGISFSNGASKSKNRKTTPHNFPAINEQTALEAYSLVLASAGASLIRDAVDKRIADEVQTGTSTYGNDGIIDSQDDVGGWPVIEEVSRATDFDTDGDGMPDDWEVENELDANNPNDRNSYSLNSDYTNLEVYINSLVDVPNTGIFDGNKTVEPVYCYPNPNRGQFNIDLTSIDEPKVEIYNSIGQLVHIQEADRKVESVRLGRSHSGLFYLRVVNPQNKVFIQKILVE